MLLLKMTWSILTRRSLLIIEQFRSDWQCGSFRNSHQVRLYSYSWEHCQVYGWYSGGCIRYVTTCGMWYVDLCLQTWERLYSKENKASTHSRAGAPGTGSSEKPKKRIKWEKSEQHLFVGGSLPGGARAPWVLACCSCVHWLRGTTRNMHTVCCFQYMAFWKERKHFFIPESSSVASSLSTAFQQAAVSRPGSAPEELNFQLPSISFGLRLH